MKKIFQSSRWIKLGTFPHLLQNQHWKYFMEINIVQADDLAEWCSKMSLCIGSKWYYYRVSIFNIHGIGFISHKWAELVIHL